jgi:pantetheine-phosphate adenylyltransferase
MSGRIKIGLFPGTFDPATNGHLDVIERGRALFDKLIVAVARNPAKSELFSMQERLDMLNALVGAGDDVAVQSYEGLTVDYARRVGAVAILRGLRNVTDLAYEFQLALTNRAVAEVETVFIMTGESYAFTSSTLIKQIAAAADSNIDRLHRLLPPLVIEKLKEKKQRMGPAFTAMLRDGLKD